VEFGEFGIKPAIGDQLLLRSLGIGLVFFFDDIDAAGCGRYDKNGPLFGWSFLRVGDLGLSLQSENYSTDKNCAEAAPHGGLLAQRETQFEGCRALRMSFSASRELRKSSSSRWPSSLALSLATTSLKDGTASLAVTRSVPSRTAAARRAPASSSSFAST